MNDSSVVCAPKRTCYLNAVSKYGLWRQAHICRQFTQRFTLDQLHHDVEFAVCLSNFMDGADIRMSERGRSTGFVQQILTGEEIRTGLFLNYFQCHVTVQQFVASVVNNSHSSFPDL